MTTPFDIPADMPTWTSKATGLKVRALQIADVQQIDDRTVLSFLDDSISPIAISGFLRQVEAGEYLAVHEAGFWDCLASDVFEANYTVDA
jgi:hypothetical protein